MEAVQLTPGAVKAIAEHPDGPGTIKPVLQVVDVRPVTTKNAKANTSERFRMMLSDGVHTQQSMLGTALNHLVKSRILRAGTIVLLTDVMCNTIQGKRIVIVVNLEVLQSECAIIGSPKHYEAKSLTKEQDPNLPASAAQTNSGIYSGGPPSVAPRAEQAGNNQSYGGPYNGAQGMVGSSIGRTAEPGPNNVFSGGSYGTMSAHNTINANMAQPTSQQPSLNSHQNQRFPVPSTGGGLGPPRNTYGRPAQPSYQQLTPEYANRGPLARNESTSRIIPITALNPYQNKWTIKARVTAKTDIRHFTNAQGPGTLFSFNLLDAEGGEIRATCFKEAVNLFYHQIEVDKVYLISRGSLKPAQKKFNPLNHDYEITLNAPPASVEICSDDDNSIPRQRFNFRPISEIENMDTGALVDLLGVVASVNPIGTIMTKNGTETQKRTLQLKDMSGRSIEVTLWGNFCDVEGQQLQLHCDSGLKPILAMKGARVSDFGGRSVSTNRATQLKLNPDFPDAEKLWQWYINEGKTAACISLSQDMSGMSRADVRKTIAQIKDENLGRSDKPDWITIQAAISHVQTENFCYPACTLMFNEKQCNKKAINNGDGTWHCDRCDQNFPECEYRYLVTCQIQDHTGTIYVTGFQEAGEQIFGRPAQELYRIRNVDQDDALFAEIIEGARWHLYLVKLKVKEETFNDESRVKCSIVKVEKLDPSKESNILLGSIDSLLLDGSGSSVGAQGAAVAPNTGFTILEGGHNMLTSNNAYPMNGLGSSIGVQGAAVVPNAGFTSLEGSHGVVTSNNAYPMNMAGANQFGQQASINGGMSTLPSAARNVQTCSACGSIGHNTQNCTVGMDIEQPPPAGGGFTGSNYGSSSGNAIQDICFKCNQPGHWARDCPGQATGPQHQRQAYGNNVASSGCSRQSFVGGY